MGLRLTAVIPLVASVVTVALTIVLLASGQSPNNANNDFWIAVSTCTKCSTRGVDWQ